MNRRAAIALAYLALVVPSMALLALTGYTAYLFGFPGIEAWCSHQIKKF